MKKLLLLIGLILLWTTSTFSYDIQLTGNIPLTDKISGIGHQASVIAAISRETKTLYLIDTQTNTITKKISLEITPSGIAVDNNRNQAIVSSADGLLHFFDLDTGNTAKTIFVKRHSAPPIKTFEGMLDAESRISIHSIAINPQNDLLYIGNSNSLMALDLTTGDIIKEASLPDTVTSMAIDPNLGYLVIIMDENVIARSETPSPVIARDEVPKQSQGTIGAGSAISKDGIASPLVRNDKKRRCWIQFFLTIPLHPPLAKGE
ncbi:MAG: hypothetical protein HY752_04720 [Nitrospirae bacterium]|nr:hypothetical protein [Nitrospirota bacterium]